MAETLQAFEISKSYGGRKVVDNVSLTVDRGEVVGLLGPNGAGKTTSFYMMVGLVKADSGNIGLNQDDLTDDPIHIRAAKGVGYLPQEASIFRELTTKENIYSVLELRSLRKSKKEQLLNELLEDFSLQKVQNQKGKQLSGGERRRVEIARSLALDPKFILLDEPFAGVDPLAVSEIQNIITQLKGRGIGILITDHNVRETLGIVDRAYIMSDGKILVSGNPSEIVQSESAKKYYLGDQFRL